MTNTDPSNAAMGAAEAIKNEVYEWRVRGSIATVEDIGRLIDRETGVKELIALLKRVELVLKLDQLPLIKDIQQALRNAERKGVWKPLL